MISLLVGKPNTVRQALARALIVPVTICAALAAMFGGAVLMGAELPDGTVEVTVVDP